MFQILDAFWFVVLDAFLWVSRGHLGDLRTSLRNAQQRKTASNMPECCDHHRLKIAMAFRVLFLLVVVIRRTRSGASARSDQRAFPAAD